MLARGLLALALSITAYTGYAAGAAMDLGGDGKSEIIIRSANGQLRSGSLVNNQFQFAALNDPGVNFRLLGIADFNGNGKPDLAYQDLTQGATGDVHIWTDFAPAGDVLLRTVKRTWDVQAVGDLDGDGFADLVWRYVVSDSPDTGVSYIWFTNGGSVTQVRKRGGAPLNWQMLGAMDLNGDGAADVIYLSPDRQIRLLMATAGRTCANISAGSLLSGFSALKLGDFTGNHLGEILLRNPDSGQISILQIDASGLNLPAPTANPDDPNASCTSSTLSARTTQYIFDNASPDWQLYATGDFNGDGRTDVVWLRPDGTLTLWLMNASGKVPVSATVINNAGTAPAGFTAIQVIDGGVSTSRVLDKTSQTVSAAAGASIVLPGGNGRLNIPAGFLPSNQLVSVSLLSALRDQPASGMIAGTGPALSVTFTPAGGSAADESPPAALLPSATSTTLDFQFNYSTSAVANPAAAIPLLQVLPPDMPTFDNKGVFLGASGSVDTTQNSATISMPANMFSQFKFASDSSPSTVNVSLGTWNPTLRAPIPDQFGGRLWDPAAQQWVPVPFGGLDKNQKTCVLVHGILSSVESAFTNADTGKSCVNDIAAANGCNQVVGFNYNFWDRNAVSGKALADFLAQSGLKNIILETHSMGGAVALAALAYPQTQGVFVEKFVPLGGPLMGTAAAQRLDTLVSLLANLDKTVPTQLLSIGLAAHYIGSFTSLADALQNSSAADVVPGNAFLRDTRNSATTLHPEMEVFPIAGSGGSLLDNIPPYVQAEISALLAKPGTPAWETALLQNNQALSKALLHQWLFGNLNEDSIVDVPSALGTGSDLNIPAGVGKIFPITHTRLECDPGVIQYVGNHLKNHVCAVTVAPPSLSVLKQGQSGSLLVTADRNCPWTIAPGADWISIASGPIGGTNTVNYTIAPNTGPPRTSAIVIGSATVPVSQEGCTYAITPPGLSLPAAGGTGNLAVATQNSCTWTVGYSDSWIFAGPASGSGPGTVAYSVLPNTGVQRNGSITIADQTVPLSQAAGTSCTYSLSASGTSVAAAGGGGSIVITTGADASNCPWTAASNASWLTVSNNSGTGSRTITFTAAANPGAASRTGTITIGGQTVTVTQAGSCSYSISPTSQTFTASGGGGSTIVTAAMGCAWTAVSNSSFLTAVAPASGTGSGTVTFSVLANGTTSSRTGTLTIAGQTFTVTEAGTSAPGSTTGTWAGNWNKHFGGFGDGVLSLTWNLVQTGNSVTGTYTTVMLSCDGLCPDPVGTVTNGNLVQGTVSGSTLTIFTEGGTSFNATISGSTLSGTSGGSFPGTFTLTKQ